MDEENSEQDPEAQSLAGGHRWSQETPLPGGRWDALGKERGEQMAFRIY